MLPAMPAEPTPRQKEILEFIVAFRGRHGHSPTVMEMSAHFGISKTSVHEHCLALVDKGRLRKVGNHTARNFEPTGEALVALASVERAVDTSFDAGGRAGAIKTRLQKKLKRLPRRQ